jgi:Short C-terminal domain
MRRGRPVVVAPRRGPGLMGTMAKTAVIAGTATVAVKATSSMMGGGSKKQAEAQQSQDIAQLQAQQDALAQQQAAAQQAAAAQAAAAPAAPSGGDSLDDQLVQIQKLSAMKDQGVLTEEEFAAKKAQILGI